MPAAAKVEKTNPTEVTNKMANVTNNNQTQDPTKIANTIIEKKIRNLEKRKARLLEIKALEDKGQQLEAEQKIAVKKLDSVVEMIDTLKDINKNVSDSLNEYAKQQKKLIKKEQLEKQQERQQQELDKVKMLLNMQALLTRLPNLKTYLTEGEGKSINIDDKQIQALDKIAEQVNSDKVDNLTSGAEKIILVLDGSKKEFTTGVSCLDLKETFTSLIKEKCIEKLTSSALDNNVVTSLPEPTTQIDEVVSSEPLVTENSPKPETFDSTPVATNVEHLKSHLGGISFMRDPVAETDLQTKDPAVVASGMAYPPPLANSTPPNLATSNAAHYPYPPVSIPTQTFTNQNYTNFIPTTTPFISVTMPTSMPAQISFPVEQSMQIRTMTHEQQQQDSAASVVIANLPDGKSGEPISSDPKAPNNNGNETLSTLNKPSQENQSDSKQVNGDGSNHFKRPNQRARGSRGGYGNFGNFRGGRGGKYSGGGGGGYGHFNGHANQNGSSTNGNFNNGQNRPPMNRPNGGGQRPYRGNSGGGNRANFHSNNNQGPNISIASK